MIIFVDGFQNTGKTTLLDNCKYKHDRFPFNQYLDKFGLNAEINGFQIGKDLGILFGLQFTNENIVFDRGPLSTIFYSLKEDRYGKDTAKVIVKFLIELKKYPNCKYIFVKKINDPKQVERNHSDGFDYLDDDNDPEKDNILDMMRNICYHQIDMVIFENDFSDTIEHNSERFNALLEVLMDEHD